MRRSPWHASLQYYASYLGHRRSVRFRRSGCGRKGGVAIERGPSTAWRTTAARTTGTAKSATIAVQRTTSRWENHVPPAGTTVHRTPSMGRPFHGLTPDRSWIRPKSSYAQTGIDIPALLVPGAPPRRGQSHPSSAPRRSDPPVDRASSRSRRGARVRVTRTRVREGRLRVDIRLS